MSYFYDDDQSREANLLRLEMHKQEEQSRRDHQSIDRLLWELSPRDALADLFTFVEMYTWGLKHEKKRPRE